MDTQDANDNAPAWTDEELERAFGVTDEDDSSTQPPVEELEELSTEPPADPPAEPSADLPVDPPADPPVDPPADRVALAPDPSDPSDPSPAPAPSAGPDTIEIGGELYNRADVEAQLAWASSLTPEQVNAIANALSPQQANSTQPNSTQPNSTAPTPPAPSFDPDDSIDPNLARYVNERLAAQQAEISELAQYREQIQQAQQSQRVQNLTDGYQRARAELTQRYGFTDEDVSVLEAQMEQTQIVAAYAQRTSDPVELFTRAYEDTLWTTPAFRKQMIAEQARREAVEQAAAEQAAAEQARQAERATRRENASRLSGGGTAARSDSPPDLSTAEARRDALTEGIAEALRGR